MARGRQPLFFGFATIGIKPYPPSMRGPIFTKWEDMLKRCYGKSRIDDYAKYDDCTVDPQFWVYKEFEEWANQQVSCCAPGFHLDKDILVRGNRVYGPDTCCFVPPAINSCIIGRVRKKSDLPIGVLRSGKRYSAQIMVKPKTIRLGLFDTPSEAFAAYKEAKEARIKAVAHEWRGRIDERVFNALMNWEVLISE